MEWGQGRLNFQAGKRRVHKHVHVHESQPALEEVCVWVWVHAFVWIHAYVWERRTRWYSLRHKRSQMWGEKVHIQHFLRRGTSGSTVGELKDAGGATECLILLCYNFMAVWTKWAMFLTSLVEDYLGKKESFHTAFWTPVKAKKGSVCRRHQL